MQRLREPQGATTVARNGGVAAVAGGARRLHAAHTTMAAAGGIEIICGPMFSGKTTALLARVASEEAAGRKVVLLKSALDDRYGASTVVSHDGKQRVRATGQPTLARTTCAIMHGGTARSRLQTRALTEAICECRGRVGGVVCRNVWR